MRAGTGANRCHAWTVGEGVKSIEAALRKWAPGLFGDPARVPPVYAALNEHPSWSLSDAAGEALDDHIRVLLPWDLRADDTADALESDPVGELLSALPQNLDSQLVRSISQASISGEDAVTLALGKRLEEVLSEEAQP
jgi:hypothetical protein